MKRNFYCLSIAVFSVASYSSCFANAPQVVYGLEKAKHFDSQTNNQGIYIQVGSFKVLSNASGYQQRLKSKTKHNVKMSHKGDFYSILIGPLYSSAEIRKTAADLLGQSKETTVKTMGQIKKQQHLTYKKQLAIIESHPHITAPVMHSTHIMSETAINPMTNSTANWFVAAGAGGQFPLSFHNMHVNNGSGFPTPYNQDSYSMNNTDGAIFALSAGRRWARDSVWLPAYSAGVLWQHFFNMNDRGTVMQYSDPTFTNYNYSWNIKSNMLLATAKLDLVQYWKLSPYINGGIGAAFNNTSGYTETALAGVTPRDNPGFANNNSTQFAYQAGAGLDLQVSPQVIFSLGYNYQNLGGLYSGSGVGSWSNKSLSSSSFGSNEVLVSVNYLFGK